MNNRHSRCYYSTTAIKDTVTVNMVDACEVTLQQWCSIHISWNSTEDGKRSVCVRVPVAWKCAPIGQLSGDGPRWCIHWNGEQPRRSDIHYRKETQTGRWNGVEARR